MSEILQNYEDFTREGNRKFLIVAVDYFIKWAEAEALAAITT